MLPGDRGYYMYVLACSDHSLYAGYTVDLPKRLACHQAGKASKYTRTRLPVQVRAWWSFPTQRAALQAEIAFKALSRGEKLRRLKSGFMPVGAETPNAREDSQTGASAPSDLGITANG